MIAQFALRQHGVLINFLKGANHQSAACAAVQAGRLPRPEGMRHYLKAVPNTPAAGLRPLVVLLHGGGASANQVLGREFPASPFSMWLEIAERENLIVMAPDAARRGMCCWNDGSLGKHLPQTDDVGLIRALIEHAIAHDHADPERVYVMGVSRGGMPATTTYAPPAMALPALVVASTADPFMPYGGGNRWYTLGRIPPMMSVSATLATWRGLAHLPAEAHVEAVPHVRANDPTRVMRHTWGRDEAGLQVRLLSIAGGGHAEPSIAKRYPGMLHWFPGAQNADLEVAEEAWAFFRHKRRAGALHTAHILPVQEFVAAPADKLMA